jgi:hypothetical protein
VNFSGARDSFRIIFFKNQGSNYEIKDYGLILEKPRGFFATLQGIINSRIIFVRKKPWTWSTGHGPHPALVHGGLRWCGQEHGGVPAGARRGGATSHRRLLRGAGEGEGDVAVSGVHSPETER